MKIRQVVIDVIVTLLMILWVYASLSKLLEYNIFKFQLGQSPYLTKWNGELALVLPLGELMVALLLLSNRWRLLGLYLSFFLMLLFTGYIYSMLHFSHYVPCSCGGILSKMSWEFHLIFNIVFTLLALFGILISIDLKRTMTNPLNSKTVQL